jgi:hypothetical protein
MSERKRFFPDNFRRDGISLVDGSVQNRERKNPIVVYSKLTLGLATLAAVGLIFRHREEKPPKQSRRERRRQAKQPQTEGKTPKRKVSQEELDFIARKEEMRDENRDRPTPKSNNE